MKVTPPAGGNRSFVGQASMTSVRPAAALLSGTGEGRGADTLFKILLSLTAKAAGQGGEIGERIGTLPARDRLQAMAVQAELSRRGVELTREEWNALWKEIGSRESALIPREDRELREGEETAAPNHAMIGGEGPLIRIFRDRRGRGRIVREQGERGAETLYIHLETNRRDWEFRLVSHGKSRPRLTAYTNDEEIAARPPREWRRFIKRMKKNGVDTTERIKLLRKPLIFTENVSREMDHLVDIIL